MGVSLPTPIDRRDRTEPLNRRRNRGCAEMFPHGFVPDLLAENATVVGIVWILPRCGRKPR